MLDKSCPREVAGFAKYCLPAAMALAGALSPNAASAAYSGSLVFLEPTGIVGPTDEIPVWLRFTLDSSSEPLAVTNNPGDTPPFGVPLANYPTSFQTAWGPPEYDGRDIVDITLTTLTQVYVNTYFGCGQTFSLDMCTSGPPYKFEFNTSGPDSINFLPASEPFALAPGAYRDYLFGTFKPSAGPVAPGTYTFNSTGLTLNFMGTGTGWVAVVDEDGYPVPMMVPVLDEFDNPILVQALDESGDPLTDDYGDPVYVQALDEYGNPLWDEDNNPVYQQVMEPLIDPSTGAPFPMREEWILDVFGTYDLAGTASGTPFVRTVAPVPLPGAIWMFGAGAGLLGLFKRRKTRG